MVMGGRITLGDLLVQLLDYGTATQLYMGYRLDKLANAGYTDAVAHTHTWDDGVVTKAPTETETGIMTYTCTVCGTTKTEVIPKLIHAGGGGAGGVAGGDIGF